MNIVNSMRKGFFLIADIYTRPRAYARASDSGFRLDNMHLQGDVRRIADDMKSAIAKYDEQTYSRPGY